MRNFPDFLEAYLKYSRDNFCPDKFHFWTGISVVAGALERKVWVRFANFELFPNLYILMLSYPGMGKTTAGNIGVNRFLSRLEAECGGINFTGSQNSQASFVEQMARWKTFFAGEKELTHASSFFYASEGSDALTELKGGGNVIATLTNFYDCPDYFKKSLISGTTEIKNACCNVLACATFSFLDELVPKKQAEGGFASRLLYVVEDQVIVREPKWHAEKKDSAFEEKLLSDLQQIYQLSGQFVPTNGFLEAYHEWFPRQDLITQSMKSERMQRFMARKHTNLLKLCMICAVSEGSDLRLDVRHWERAMTLMSEVELKLPKVVGNSVDKATPQGFNYVLLKTLQDHSGVLTRKDLNRALLQKGLDVSRLDSVLLGIQNAGLIVTEIAGPGVIRYKLTADPNDYL